MTGANARRRETLGIAAVVGSALAFGTMAIFARIAYASGVDITTLLALRFTIACVVMAPMMRWQRQPWPRGRVLGIALLMGAIGYAGQAMSFFTALTLAPAGLVALLLYLHPALVALLSAALGHERLGAPKLAALVVALAGLLLTVGPAVVDGTAANAQPAGIALGLAAAAIYSVYIVVGARTARATPALAMSTVVICGAATVFLAAAAARGVHPPRDAVGWWAVAAIALVSTVLAVTLYFAGLARVGPTRASTLSTIEPVFTVALAAIVLGERILPVQFAGGVLILAAVLLLARAAGPAPRTQEAPA